MYTNTAVYKGTDMSVQVYQGCGLYCSSLSHELTPLLKTLQLPCVSLIEASQNK